ILADPDARRLYVTHGPVVHILDLDRLAPIARVTGFKKAHGVALSHGKGYASDGDGNRVLVFDPVNGRVLKTINAGGNPDSILT
ncbi:YncE family protein, partial [Stenotrophomonas maltophilia]